MLRPAPPLRPCDGPPARPSIRPPAGPTSIAAALLASILAGLPLLPGCTVGPDHVPPPAPVPAAWLTAGTDASVTYLRQSPDARWWARFGDPVLSDLIETAVRENLDVAIATARVREARAMIGIAEARLRPMIGAAAAYDRARLSEDTPILERFIELGQVDTEQELFSAAVDASWELDIFGGARRGAEAAVARADARVAEQRDAVLSVVAEVARTYFQLRGAQAELDAVERSTALRQQTLDLVLAQRTAGLATDTDVVRARGEVQATEAEAPGLRTTIVAAGMRLAVLTARPVDELWRQVRDPAPLPPGPGAVPIGLTGELLRRRMDVRAAERTVAAASAAIGVAVADLYPRFALTGTVGLQAQDFPQLFESSSRAWIIGPSIRWPILQGGRLRARVDAAEARHRQALLAHRAAVLAAVADVETRLTGYANAHATERRLRQLVETQTEAVELARRAHEEGLGDLPTVIDAQRQLAEARRGLARAHAGVLIALASLNTSLGGGWPMPEEAAAGGAPDATVAPEAANATGAAGAAETAGGPAATGAPDAA